MKTLTVLLIIMLSATVSGFTPQTAANYAELAGYYYSWYGVETGYLIPEWDLSNTPEFSTSLYHFIPTREGYNLLHRIGYEGIDGLLSFSSAAATRHSPLLYGGAKAEVGYRFKAKDFVLKLEPSLLYKKTGNLDYGLVNNLQLRFGQGGYFANRMILTSGINIDRLNRLTASIDTRADIVISWQTSYRGTFNKFTLATDRIITSGRRINVYWTIGFQNRYQSLNFNNQKQYYPTHLTTGFSGTKHLQYNMSFNRQYGPYTPPILFAPTIFPVIRDTKPNYGLALMRVMDNPPPPDIVITVRRGDNLNLISRRLPPEADDTYRNNVTAIASYNNIRPPYVIHPGEQLRIPPKIIFAKADVPADIDEQDLRSIKNAVSVGRTSDLMEVRLNTALWSFLTEGQTDMLAILPVRADIENKYLLNTQSIAEIALRNPKSAIRKLRFALAIDENCPVLNTNLALAYFQDNRLLEAREYLSRAIKLSETYNMDSDFLRRLEAEIDRKLPR